MPKRTWGADIIAFVFFIQPNGKNKCSRVTYPQNCKYPGNPWMGTTTSQPSQEIQTIGHHLSGGYHSREVPMHYLVKPRLTKTTMTCKKKRQRQSFPNHTLLAHYNCRQCPPPMTICHLNSRCRKDGLLADVLFWNMLVHYCGVWLIVCVPACSGGKGLTSTQLSQPTVWWQGHAWTPKITRGQQAMSGAKIHE